MQFRLAWEHASSQVLSEFTVKLATFEQLGIACTTEIAEAKKKREVTITDDFIVE